MDGNGGNHSCIYTWILDPKKMLTDFTVQPIVQHETYVHRRRLRWVGSSRQAFEMALFNDVLFCDICGELLLHAPMVKGKYRKCRICRAKST